MNTPVMNDMALAQMQNSDALYVATNTYDGLRPIVSSLYIGVMILLWGSIVWDIVKIIKEKKGNK